MRRSTAESRRNGQLRRLLIGLVFKALADWGLFLVASYDVPAVVVFPLVLVAGFNFISWARTSFWRVLIVVIGSSGNMYLCFGAAAKQMERQGVDVFGADPSLVLCGWLWIVVSAASFITWLTRRIVAHRRRNRAEGYGKGRSKAL